MVYSERDWTTIEKVKITYMGFLHNIQEQCLGVITFFLFTKIWEKMPEYRVSKCEFLDAWLKLCKIEGPEAFEGYSNSFWQKCENYNSFNVESKRVVNCQPNFQEIGVFVEIYVVAPTFSPLFPVGKHF